MPLKNLIGEVLDGKYRIEKQLGEGGMGAVYLATHLGTERPVALKVIAPQFMKHDEFVERFRREARAAGRLRHPNVVDVTDFGFARVGADQVAYLVMEYLDGCTLDEILAEETSLPLGWVIDILEQTSSAVDEAHQQGIIHRDLKPDNIWLEPNRRGGYTVKVLDFGIAKLDEPAQNSGKRLSSQNRAPVFDSLAPTQASESATLTPDASRASYSLEGLEAATRIQKANVTDADLSEAGTRVFQPDSDASEAGTQMYEPESDSSEAGTQMMPGNSLGEAGTRMLEHHTTDRNAALQTAVSSSSLTRVGSILGTPLYMSPEQCRGEALDARADIYSLGVIAYRLLAGKTPFSGDLPTVMKMHREEPPPPLQVKGVPKKIKKLVMSSLAKDPTQRPASAGAFAGALRAHSEGSGSLIRRGLTFYAEHLPTLMRLALMVYAPVAVTTILQVTFGFLSERGTIPKPWGGIFVGLAMAVNLVVTFFSASIVGGVTTWLVTQKLAVPLRPLELRPAFAALKKRMRPYLKAAAPATIATFVGIMMCLLPGLFLAVNYALLAPVLIMEDLKGHAAFLRARQLFNRSRRTVIAIVFVHFGVPFLMSIITSLLITAIFRAINPEAEKGAMKAVNLIQQIVQLPFIILFGSLVSVVTALLYWKTRLAGGETLRDAFNLFMQEETSASRWQQRMRTRFHTPTRTTR
jgi:serine/threonine protein kinase